MINNNVCESSLSNVADIITVIISTINLVFVIVFTIYGIIRNRKDQKIVNNNNWFETFGFGSEISTLVNSFYSFKKRLLDCIGVSDSTIIKEYYGNCIADLNSFKGRFLDVTKAILPEKIIQLTDSINEIEDKASDIFALFLTNKTEQQIASGIEEIISFMVEKLIKTAYQLTTDLNCQ